MRRPTPPEQRFWAKVVRAPGCWKWLAHHDRLGYARFRERSRGWNFAHRVAYELMRGPIPAGLELDHLCRNTSCVNPDHLEPVTHRTNIMRGLTLMAENAAKTHCAHGHLLDEANTMLDNRGWRECRTCKRATVRRANERYAAKRRAGNGSSPS